jgi:hypothetical protein
MSIIDLRVMYAFIFLSSKSVAILKYMGSGKIRNYQQNKFSIVNLLKI